MFILSNKTISGQPAYRSFLAGCRAGTWLLLSLLVFFPIFLTGCGKDEGVYQFSSESSAGSVTAASATASASRSDETDVSETEESDPAYAPGTTAADAQDTSAAGAADQTASPDGETTCYVYVCGAVHNPGVYALPSGSRVYEAIAMAGGMTGDADDRSLNQALAVTDGQQITVYTREEMEKYSANGGVLPGQEKAGETGNSAAADPVKSRVNINTATKEELMTLTGIGEARASAIIAYREEHGAFSSIEDIMLIEGIKEKAFAKIRDSIEV